MNKIDFDKYLDLIGAERGDKTNNEWELARFIANDIICVIYENKKGNISFSNDTAKKVYDNWQKGIRINVQSIRRKSLTYKFKKKLFERDGNKCFYSNDKMTFEEATIEHLISLAKGGKNNLDNLVLCLEKHNKLMADQPLIKKINYKITFVSMTND